MAPTLDELKNTLAGLCMEERAELAQFLIESLDETVDDDEAAWEQELARRAEEIRQGNARGKPAEEVFRELRERT